jgi:hypothetical protein
LANTITANLINHYQYVVEKQPIIKLWQQPFVLLEFVERTQIWSGTKQQEGLSSFGGSKPNHVTLLPLHD